MTYCGNTGVYFERQLEYGVVPGTDRYADYKLEPSHADDVHLRGYTGDSGFKQKKMNVDLNGDGREEEIQLILPETELGTFKLKVNNITMEVGSELLP